MVQSGPLPYAIHAAAGRTTQAAGARVATVAGTIIGNNTRVCCEVAAVILRVPPPLPPLAAGCAAGGTSICNGHPGKIYGLSQTDQKNAKVRAASLRLRVEKLRTCSLQIVKFLSDSPARRWSV